jgi:hypothetical protein
VLRLAADNDTPTADQRRDRQLPHHARFPSVISRQHPPFPTGTRVRTTSDSWLPASRCARSRTTGVSPSHVVSGPDVVALSIVGDCEGLGGGNATRGRNRRAQRVLVLKDAALGRPPSRFELDCAAGALWRIRVTATRVLEGPAVPDLPKAGQETPPGVSRPQVFLHSEVFGT